MVCQGITEVPRLTTGVVNFEGLNRPHKMRCAKSAQSDAEFSGDNIDQ